MSRTHRRWTSINILTLLTLFATSAGNAQARPISRSGTLPHLLLSKQIDVCQIVQGDSIKLTALLQGITTFFPIDTAHDGEHVRLSDPKIWKKTCPNLFLEIHTHMQYWKTRGLIQYQFSAGLTFTAHLAGTVYYASPAGAPVSTANFVRAKACLQNIDIVGLDIQNLPTWFSDWDVVKGYINDKLGHNTCFDVTKQVQTLLTLGVTL